MQLRDIQSRAARTAYFIAVAALIAWFSPASPAGARESLDAQSGTLYLKSSPDAEAVD